MATTDARLGNAGNNLTAARAAVLRILRRYSFGFALVLAGVLLTISVLTAQGGFGTREQLANVAPIALAAMASAPSIISGGGGLDLTVSPVMFLTGAVYVTWLLPHGVGGPTGVLLVLLMAMAIGVFNAVLIVGLRVQPVVATLSTYFFLLGLDLQLVPVPVGIDPTTHWVGHLAGSIGPLPGPVVTIGAPLLIWAALARIPFRRTLYAVGSNDATAFSSGVNVDLVRVGAYALGGLFAGIGGFALLALNGSVDTAVASTYTLVAIASVALGGTSLWGGRGGLFGPLLGATCIYLLSNLLTQAQISPSWLQVMYGGLLLVAVMLSSVTTRGET